MTPEVTPFVIMHSLNSGFQPIPFSDSLFTERSNNMVDLREQAAKYMAIEKIKQGKKGQKALHPNKRKN